MLPIDQQFEISKFENNSVSHEKMVELPMIMDSTLYIGNLEPSIEELFLYDLFNPFGEIKSCKVVRDIYSNESRRFAFITYSNKEDALEAKKNMEYKIIRDYEIRISFKRNPQDFKPEANIFVKNLPENYTAKQLNDLCSEYGEILSCTLRRNEQGKSLRYGYIQYQSQDQAEKSILNLKQKKIEGHEILVSKFIPQKQRNSSQKNLYFKNFPYSWNETDVKNFLQKIEDDYEVTSSGVYSCNIESVIRYFAFAAFLNEENANEVKNNLSEKKLSENEEQLLFVTYALSKSQRKKELEKQAQDFKNQTNIYVRSIKEQTTNSDINRIFQKFGKITSISLNISQNNPYTKDPLKYCFINYQTHQEAHQAYFQGKNDGEVLGLIHKDHKRGIEFLFFAQSKLVRKQFLEMKQKIRQSMYNSNLMFYQMQQAQQYQQQMMNIYQQQQQAIMNNFEYNYIQPNFNYFYQQNQQIQPILPIVQKEMKIDLGWIIDNKIEFLEFSQEKQRNILGDMMFKRISNINKEPELNSKITGMLIDLDILEFDEILEILSDDNILNERFQEAKEVLKETDLDSNFVEEISNQKN